MTTLDDVRAVWFNRLPPSDDDPNYTARYQYLRGVCGLHPAVAAVMAADIEALSPVFPALSPGFPQGRTAGMVT